MRLTRTHCSNSRPAFTLVEVALSLAIMSILALGMSAALVMSLKGADAGVDASQRALRAQEALGRVMADASVAVAINESSDTVLDLKVPERVSGAGPVRICYEWVGGSGGTLVRTVNGVSETILTDVRGLTFRTMVRPPPESVTSAHQTVFSLAAAPSGASTDTVQVQSPSQVGAYVLPTMPSNAISWTISGIRVKLNNGSSSGNITFKLVRANADRTPSASQLATYTLTGSALKSVNGWMTLPLTSPSLTPTQGVCLVVSGSTSGSGSGGNAGSLEMGIVRQSPATTLPTNASYLTSSNGTTWTSDGTRDLLLTMTGTITTNVEQPPQ